MNILILSSGNGGGHNAVSRAVAECFEAHGDSCVIKDCLSFLSGILPETVSLSHTCMYRYAPGLFDSSFRRSENKPGLFGEKRFARKIIDLGRFSLGKFIMSGDFRPVICTHVFGAMMLTSAKRQYGLDIRTAIIETDHVNTPGSSDNDMDHHFLPDESLIPGLIAAGVDESKLIVSGIPVRKEIYLRTDKAEAKRRLGLDPERGSVLIAGGSMGCGPIPLLVERLREMTDDDVQISVVCGTNEHTRKKLAAEYADEKDVHIHGAVSEMSLLYDASDVLMTKPGGVTTAEAAVKGLPMVLINAVAGCETHNLDYYVGKGCALTGDTPRELCERCLTLLRDRDRAARMSEALRGLSRGSAAEIIYETMTRTNE